MAPAPSTKTCSITDCRSSFETLNTPIDASARQVQEKLLVAGRAGDRRRRHRDPRRARSAAAASVTRAITASWTAGSVTSPCLPTSSRPASNCGFTSATTSAAGARNGGSAGRMCRSEMNATSIVTSVDAMRHVVGRQRARVDPFADEDARVGAQPPIELAVADVERDDAGRAALEQHVGEAAGRRADVERAAPVRVDAERVERVRELDAAAARRTDDPA